MILFLVMHLNTFCLITAYALDTKKALSFEGKIIFVNSNYYREPNIHLLDGEMGRIKKLTTVGDNRDPQWAPDGKKIVFTSKRKDHSWEIYVMNPDGKDQTRLTYTASGFSTQPRWSGNGKQIFFFSNNLKGALSENILNLSTGEVRTLHTFGPRIQRIQIKGQPLKEHENVETLKEEIEKAIKQAEDILGKFKGDLKVYPSPDGRYFLINHSPYPGKLILINIETKSETTLEIEGSDPAWDKDGKKIAFMTRHPYGTLGILVIYDLNEKKYDKIVLPRTETQECGHPSWSRDSRKIVYVTGPVGGHGEVWLYILDIETRKFLKLIQGYNPDWY